MADPISVRFKLEQLETIDELVAQHPYIGDRNSLIRSLMDHGLEGLRKEIKLLKHVKK